VRAQAADFDVLNAFRHHRGGHVSIAIGRLSKRGMCSTPFGITEVGIIGRGVDEGLVGMCSTPFGITEVGMRGHSLAPRTSPCVLNAFRHHRGGHDNTFIRQHTVNECSTPFGITEVGILATGWNKT